VTSLIRQLSDHLTAKADALRIRPEQFAVDVDSGTIEPGGGNVTAEGYHAADFRYTATLSFGGLPGGSLQLLLLLVLCWITEHDQHRERYKLPWPTVETMAAGDGTCDVQLEIAFVDQFHLGEDPDGPLTINSTRYAVDAFELHAATAATVQGGAA
jgi:hypothetical protein